MAVLKYYLAMSNRYEVDQPGYYYITARNTEGNLIPKGKVSNMIYVPYPTKLNDESLTIVNEFETGDGSAEAPAAIFLGEENKVELNISVDNPAGDVIDYSWTEADQPVEDATTNTFMVATIAGEAALFDEQVMVKAFTKRNNAHTEFEKDTHGNVIDTSVYKHFRVTERPHKFMFRTEPTNEERQTQGLRVREEFSEDGVTMPAIFVEFSGSDIANPDAQPEEQTFNFLTDTIYYRWRKAVRPDANVDVYYENDAPADVEDGDDFIVLDIADNKVPTIEFDKTAEGFYYYCEIINVVNGANAKKEDETTAEYVARMEAAKQIARTEYIAPIY